MNKFLALFFICAGLGAIFFAAQKQYPALTPVSRDQKLMSGWQNDLNHLQKEKFLHTGFQSIRLVKVISQSEKLKKMYYQNPVDFKIKPDGKYTLEVFMDETEGGELMVQYDLIESSSGNTVWELGRTFPYKK